MKLVDSHFHTQSMLQRGMDVFSIYNDSLSAGIDAGCVHDDLPQRYSLLKDHGTILLAGAMGPWEAGKSETKPGDEDFPDDRCKSMEELDAELLILKGNLVRFNAAFIGEIGLDYHWEYGTREKQRHLFHTQLGWANEMGLKVIIHVREADEDVIEAIRSYGPDKGGIIHCFDGDPDLMNVALEHGYYISFAGNITFKNSKALRDALLKVPSDRLLLETDSPYLTPVPHRGKPNNPSYIVNTYQCAAEVLGMPLEKTAQLVEGNFRSFCDA